MLITFAGPDGAGKSTQSKLLYKWLVSQGYAVSILDKWDVLNHVTHPECRFIGSPLDELRTCISEMNGEGRALFLFWSIFQSILGVKNLHSKDHIYISDGYWIKHAASEVIYGNSESWIKGITSAFPKSDVVFYFDIQPSITSLRKDSYTPYECGRNKEMTTKQFITHQIKLKSLMDKWSEENNWVLVDASESVETVFNQILDKVSSEVCHA